MTLKLLVLALTVAARLAPGTIPPQSPLQPMPPGNYANLKENIQAGSVLPEKLPVGTETVANPAEQTVGPEAPTKQDEQSAGAQKISWPGIVAGIGLGLAGFVYLAGLFRRR